MFTMPFSNLLKPSPPKSYNKTSAMNDIIGEVQSGLSLSVKIETGTG